VCQFCATNQDCVNSCGTPTQTGNVWCCVSSSCYSLASNLCPASGSSSGGSGSGSGASGSGGTASMGAIVCGMAGSCMSPDVCCPGGGTGGGGAEICATPTACTAAMGDSYACTGKANCASGQVCCVVQGSNGNPDTAQCQATCTGNRHYQVCQSSAECPTGRTCRMGNVALNVCR
ncbi:MAG: hypothetical protein M3O46_08645, partial [Myxococcota bacterium]|nr:hypothetical protein [Myxococcota bacterium]